jgi:hypothetical protein
MKACFFSLFILVFVSLSFGQGQLNIKDNQGKITIHNHYDVKKKDTYLLLNKYIDTSKRIHIIYGKDTIGAPMWHLRKGVEPFAQRDPLRNSNTIFSIKLVNKNLLISSDIISFDEKSIGRLINNRLIPTQQYEEYITDSTLEIIDSYSIPVLQIELLKSLNCIYVGGAFNTSQSSIVITHSHGILLRKYGTPKLLMRPSERDSELYIYRERAKEIMPIHKD